MDSLLKEKWERFFVCECLHQFLSGLLSWWSSSSSSWNVFFFSPFLFSPPEHKIASIHHSLIYFVFFKKVFTAAAARRTKFAPTAAPGPATTLRSIRNAAKSASKAATVPRARRWTHLACAFPSTNVRASTKESNISRAIKNSDRERVRQTSGTQDSLFPPPVAIYNLLIISTRVLSVKCFSLIACVGAVLAFRPAGTVSPLRWKNGICWPT